MSIAILCLAVCVCDAMNKAGMCGRHLKIHHEPTFFGSSLEKSEPIWSCLEELHLWNEAKYFCCISTDRQTCKACKWKCLHTFCISGQLEASLGIPFKYCHTAATRLLLTEEACSALCCPDGFPWLTHSMHRATTHADIVTRVPFILLHNGNYKVVRFLVAYVPHCCWQLQKAAILKKCIKLK